MAGERVVLFSHGKESGPWGSKIQAMAQVAKEAGASVDSIDYEGIADPADRVPKLLKAIDSLDAKPLLVGSSMGGFVSTYAAAQRDVAGIFLLAPAFYMPGYEEVGSPTCPIEIVHGWRDDVVPVENSIKFAGDTKASLHILDGDHRLQENIPDIKILLHAFLNRIFDASC